MPTLQALRDKRANLWHDAKGIMAAGDDRELTAEEESRYDQLTAEIDKIGDTIEQREKHETREKAFAEIDRSGVPGAGDPQARSNLGGEDDDAEEERLGAEQRQQAARDKKYERAFTAYMRSGMNRLSVDQQSTLMDGFVDMRAAGVGTSAAGGYTVPPLFRDKMVEVIKTFGGMLQVAEVITTNTGATLPWPTNDDTANVGAILSENTQMTEQDVTFGQNNIDAYMYTSKLVRVSLQLLQDTAFNLESWLQNKLGERIGRILNQHFTTGTGTNQPDGIATNVLVGKQGAAGQTASVTYDDLIDLIDSLDPAYQGNARFMLSQSARKSVRKLKDGQQRPLWEPSIQAGVPDQLLGYGYVLNQDLPAPAASAKSVLFGDFRQAYLIRLVTDLSLIRFDERYMDFLQKGFAAYQRADGTLQNSSAVRAYQNSAT